VSERDLAIRLEDIATTVWHNLSESDALDALRVIESRGLSSQEAQVRLTAFGSNELKEAPRPTFWARLFNQFKDFLIIILIVASVISVLLGDYIEAGAIMAIVLLNAILGVIQESRAEEALAALKKMTAPEAQTLRDGRRQPLPARDLVPGDIVFLETGNYVPADVRLLEAVNLKIEEASLTGESVPVQKRADVVLEPDASLGDRKNCAFSSTVVTYGRGRGLVVNTGMQTQIGKIADLIQSFETEPTPLQRKLDGLGRTLGVAALAICTLVFIVGMARFMLNPIPGVTLLEEALEFFIVAVSLAIAAVPEGLPAVVTICLALGMQRMVARHALLRRLPAVEALGSATVICSDKTGTLTQNAMTVVQVYGDDALLNVTGEGYTPVGEFLETEKQTESPVEAARYPGINLLLRAGLLCNDAKLEAEAAVGGDDAEKGQWRMVGDPTEGALVVAAGKAGYWRDEVERDFPRVAEIPFDSDRKRMTTIHDMRRSDYSAEKARWDQLLGAHDYLAIVKGAPDLVLGVCTHLYRDGRAVPLTDADRKVILDENAGLASNALRVLAAAVRPLPAVPQEDDLNPGVVERDLIFVGLWGMIDPARPEVKPAIAVARSAGIRTVMITGDYPNTAEAIAREITLLRSGGVVLTGHDLDALDDAALSEVAKKVDVYARVSPQHKVRIVDALKAQGQIVAMTGDGVNDAPALKRADIGVAMGITGTDVSKETAAMVLTDDNYASIVAAVEEGRVIYSNIRKFVFFLLSANVGEILIILIATLLGWPLPLAAIQLLVLNLITDGAPALALGLEKGEPDIMKRAPRHPDEPVIDQTMQLRILIQGIVDTIVVLAVFRIGLAWYPEDIFHHHAQTMAFAVLSISELLRAYSARSEYHSVFRIGILTNRYMQYAVLSSLAILLAIIYVPVLDPIFNTAFLGARDWLLIVPCLFMPVIAAEVTKVITRRNVEMHRPAAA
jgi:Ca2+-transporting ATPase